MGNEYATRAFLHSVEAERDALRPFLRAYIELAEHVLQTGADGFPGLADALAEAHKLRLVPIMNELRPWAKRLGLGFNPSTRGADYVRPIKYRKGASTEGKPAYERSLGDREALSYDRDMARLLAEHGAELVDNAGLALAAELGFPPLP
jgi:hypothetical protein